MKAPTCQLLVLSILFLGAIESSGQHTYVYKFDVDYLVGRVYELVDENSMVLLTTLGDSEPVYGDIAVDPSGGLYGLSQDGYIRSIDLDAGTSTEIGLYSGLSGHTAFTCDAQSNFYTLDFYYNLIAFNTITLEETTLANLGEFSPGDLSFYNGKLVYPSSEGVIKAVDMATFEVEVIYELPPEMINLNDIYGIVNVFHNCGSEQLIVGNMSNQLFKIDVQTNTYEELDVTYDVEENDYLFGMASTDDVLASDCNEIVGLNEVLVSDWAAPIFPNPATDVIYIASFNQIERLRIYDLNGDFVKEINQPAAQENIHDLNPGYYSVFVDYSTGKSKALKLIVVR